MRVTVNTVQELRQILSELPGDVAVSFAGESGLAVFLQKDGAGGLVVSVDSQDFVLEPSVVGLSN